MRVLRGLLYCAVLLGGMPAGAEVKCIPQVLQFALNDFEMARQTGIVAKDNHGQTINLGSDIVLRTVEVRDDHKNSYSVFFHLQYVSGRVVHQTLKTQVSEVDSQTCQINMPAGSPVYSMRQDREP